MVTVSNTNYKDPDSLKSEVIYEDVSGLEIKETNTEIVFQIVRSANDFNSFIIQNEYGEKIEIASHVLEKITVWAFHRNLGDKIK